MPATARTRNDPRREAARTALIEAAERLFAQAGVEGVSIRQIGAAIGSLNTTVVAYHFGSKDALIEAVFLHRLPAIEDRRAELLAEFTATGRSATPAALMRIFALPLFEQTGVEGRHSYARFLLALERSGMLAARARLIGGFPATEAVTGWLASFVPPDPGADANTRMRLATSLIASALQIIDLSPAMAAAEREALFGSAVAMAAAAYTASTNGKDAGQ